MQEFIEMDFSLTIASRSVTAPWQLSDVGFRVSP